MPKKIRTLLKDLRKAGFYLDRQNSSHRQFKHPDLKETVTLSGHQGEDAKKYQESQIAQVIAKSQSSQ